MLGIDKDKSAVITGKYAEELRNAIRRKYEGDKVNQKEPVNEELEEEIKRMKGWWEHNVGKTMSGFETIARHFAKWGAEHLKK